MSNIDHNIQNNQKFDLLFDTKFCGRKFYHKITKNPTKVYTLIVHKIVLKICYQRKLLNYKMYFVSLEF